MFDKTHPYDLAERKINHLENLYKVTCTNVMIATEIVTITAIYKIGVTNFQFVLLCGPNRDKTGTLIDDCLVPYSFRVEDISTSRFEELYEVKYIFSKQTNEKSYSTVTYKSEDLISDLPDNIREKLKNILKNVKVAYRPPCSCFRKFSYFLAINRGKCCGINSLVKQKVPFYTKSVSTIRTH